MTEAVGMLSKNNSSFFKPLAIAADGSGTNFLALPALSNLPSESRYAGLNLSSLLLDLLRHNNALGTVS